MSQTQKSEDMKQVFTVDQNIVTDIHVADIEFRSQRDAVIALLDQHTMDLKDRITNTPIFKGMLQQTAQAFKDWQELKTDLADSWDFGGDKEIVSWKLNYETNEAVVDLADKQDRETQDFIVSDELINEVQEKHTMYDTVNSIITAMFELHALDAKDTITGSPVFKGFSEIKANYLKDFNDAKQRMFEETAPTNLNFSDELWKLNYKTKLLTIYL